MFQITPIAAFEDNYIWALCQPDHCYCLVVDPGDADAVEQFLTQQNKQLDTILITHHHGDHTGGIAKLRQRFPAVNVIGPAAEHAYIPGLLQLVDDGDTVQLPTFGLQLEVISVPGHTSGHIAYYSAPVLFCGDTLFSAGCGRLFEGTAKQMWQSLQKLIALPDSTLIYCTHEYTLSNIKFALTVEPTNAALIEYQQRCQALRQVQLPTLPTTLALEKQINPFLRCDDTALQTRWRVNSAVALFTLLRASKDQYKG
ncbi:hydroxyacylglutathione hydrolase [Rheinheimera maricola]|uniref:Hydroxyacylglutathione hydrolase n=1 Tax=Rheinheimera maricola TaxID=2793282 RepID=A0ABS7XB62_9GAMM|nr:hydroxyacylglutathione hydrolase [Rheinheimera maricola]MBZ9612012.1 hydroxyacylglutathione hydrolase [Rheinheimera maricola]